MLGERITTNISCTEILSTGLYRPLDVRTSLGSFFYMGSSFFPWNLLYSPTDKRKPQISFLWGESISPITFEDHLHISWAPKGRER